MSMLDNLKEVLDEIEEDNDWNDKFLTDMLVKYENGTLGRLTSRQLNCLLLAHEQYCGTKK